MTPTSTRPLTKSDFVQDYLAYLDASPSPYHAIQSASAMLRDAGFQEVDRAGAWPSEPGKYFFTEQGALVAWISPAGKVGSFAIVGAHSDSPSLKLKPMAQRTTADGWGQLLVEIYGSPLLNSWLDRELLVAGQLVDQNGETHLVRTPPIARVVQLAPHLNREVNTKGLVLDPQQHMQPVWTVHEPEADVLEVAASCAGLESRENIAAYDLFLYPSQEAATFGTKDQFVAAGRQDNLSSTFAALRAMAGVDPQAIEEEGRVPVLAIFDHEEVGSDTATGARGPLLLSSLRRIGWAGGLSDEGFEQALASSSVISADASHSVHPAYPDKHDPDTRPVMGAGPVLKVDADQNYATSAPGSALWQAVCKKAGFDTQHFVSESSMRSGSTIGPAISVSLGTTTVDVGIPLLSMHSAREMSHVTDTELLSRALAVYWVSTERD